jgi:hypothetical protein
MYTKNFESYIKIDRLNVERDRKRRNTFFFKVWKKVCKTGFISSLNIKFTDNTI